MPVPGADALHELRDRARERADLRRAGLRARIVVHMGTCGLAAGAREVEAAFAEALSAGGARDVALVTTGCAGFCSREPMATIEMLGAPPTTYGNLSPDTARRVFREHVVGGTIVVDAALGVGVAPGSTVPAGPALDRPEGHETVPRLADLPFYRKQQRVVLRNLGAIDPEAIDDYLARDGYAALEQALASMSPDGVVAEITRSGLRGRGGAGFPTGSKWQSCRAERRSPKYLIANCDEGDPGAYMDRGLLESDPHAVLEGMAIAAYAIAASQGYVYVRSEYPLAIQRTRTAIAQAAERGLLGPNILGSAFSFDVEIREGSGAFVCGEETALIRSIEGESPEPRPRPPFPTQSGLWGQPTVINNVETLANVPPIITRGAAWFSRIGTPTSAGTKIFSLVGRITNTGLIEVPMGLTLREIIDDIGGGVPDGKTFKAVQTGGPSGGCIPRSLFDVPVDYENLRDAGSIMGSGGMIVMDEDTCMVDVSKFFVQFTNDESCGKCSTCRDGSAALLEILTRITEGNGRPGDVELLEELGAVIKDASMCGLGTTLPQPVLSTLRHFREEYEAHVVDRRCPAKVCRSLIRYYIDPDRCPGCMLCLKSCPSQAIAGATKHIHVIDQSVCTKCGECLEVCPPKVGAVVKLTGQEARDLRSLPAPVSVAEWKSAAGSANGRRGTVTRCRP